ncbi:hypothetical protein MASR2M50_01790 [Thauera sp.]
MAPSGAPPRRAASSHAVFHAACRTRVVQDARSAGHAADSSSRCQPSIALQSLACAAAAAAGTGVAGAPGAGTGAAPGQGGQLGQGAQVRSPDGSGVPGRAAQAASRRAETEGRRALRVRRSILRGIG